MCQKMDHSLLSVQMTSNLISFQRPRPWRQTSFGTEIHWLRPPLSSGQLRWKVKWKFSITNQLHQNLSRFVLKGPSYNPMDVLNCMVKRRGYKVVNSLILNIEGTFFDRFRELLSRELFLTSTTKTTSKTFPAY